VRAITEDRAGRIWVGTEGGEVFQFHNERFERLAEFTALTASAVRAMHADS
jgi:ligand-binding sensor domain-containing protein